MRRALHSSHPDNLICREKEIAEIRSFLHNHLPKGKPGSLYISGAPGTGKTACLTRIMLEMKVNEMTMIKAKSLIVNDQYLDDHDSDSVGDSGRSRPSDEGGRGGGGHPDPEIRGAVSQKYILAFRASVWSKDKGGGGGQAPWLPLPGSATG